jgi:hypothetical protein
MRYVCNFCDQEIPGDSILPPDCECEGYKAERQRQIEEFKASDDYDPPLSKEDYDKKYPQTYKGERLVQDKDGIHKLKLEARKYGDGEGLTVWIPFPYKLEEKLKDGLEQAGTEEEDDGEGAGLCWDFTKPDAGALYDMLGEYLGVKRDDS